MTLIMSVNNENCDGFGTNGDAIDISNLSMEDNNGTAKSESNSNPLNMNPSECSFSSNFNFSLYSELRSKNSFSVSCIQVQLFCFSCMLLEVDCVVFMY